MIALVVEIGLGYADDAVLLDIVLTAAWNSSSPPGCREATGATCWPG